MNSVWPLKKKKLQTQCPCLNPEYKLPEALKIRLPRCPYLQPGNPIVIGRTDFLQAASQLSKRNSLAMVAACVLSSLLERPHPLAKLKRGLWIPTTELVYSSRGEQVNPENKSLTTSKRLQQLLFWSFVVMGRTLCPLLWLRVITAYCKS